MDILNLKFDVAICGGGTSGITAALSAARNNCKTILIERNQFLGGMLVSGLGILGYKDRNGDSIIGGIAKELFDDLQLTNDTQGHNYCPILNSLTPINSSMLQVLLLKKCDEANVHTLLSSEVIGAEVVEGEIKSILVFGVNCKYRISADVFIDATGDGELCKFAGVDFIERKSVGEIQPASLIFSLSNVNREDLIKYLEENPDEAKTPEGYEMDTSPEFYRNSIGYNILGLDSLIKKARENGDYKNIPRDRFSTITNPIPDKMTINNTRIMNFDGSDVIQLNSGIKEGFRQLDELLDFIPKYVPGYEKCQLTSISPLLGVRESRRCKGIKELQKESVLNGDIPEDTVALCGYNIDIHHGADEGSDLHIVKKAYGIPFLTLLSEKVTNLIFTGRLISADTDTFGSCRIMTTCMALGEAAGCAAALSVKHNMIPKNISIKELRNALVSEGSILEVQHVIS